MNLEDCINFLLAKSQQKVYQFCKAKLKSYGITPVQYGVLHQLWDKDGQYSSELASGIHVDGATMTGILDRLVTYGFVERKPDENDRRVNRIFLTNNGKELEHPLRQEMETMNQEVLADFNESDVIQLKKLLRQMGKIGT